MVFIILPHHPGLVSTFSTSVHSTCCFYVHFPQCGWAIWYTGKRPTHFCVVCFKELWIANFVMYLFMSTFHNINSRYIILEMERWIYSLGCLLPLSNLQGCFTHFGRNYDSANVALEHGKCNAKKNWIDWNNFQLLMTWDLNNASRPGNMFCESLTSEIGFQSDSCDSDRHLTSTSLWSSTQLLNQPFNLFTSLPRRSSLSKYQCINKATCTAKHVTIHITNKNSYQHRVALHLIVWFSFNHNFGLGR